MRNKLIILSFACLFGLYGFSQNSDNEFSQQLEINIYPNPVVEYLMVQINGEVENATFELNSMIGNHLKIQPEEIGYGKYRIPVKKLAMGYYFLIVKSEEKRFKKAFKFLKH
ncbi:MAG: T9SS type A sorting domain-containing protein [Bacteroidota bacterium]